MGYKEVKRKKMSKWKKSASMLAAVLMLVSVFAAVIPGAANPDLSVSIGSGEAAPDGTTTVLITINNIYDRIPATDNITSVGIYLYFDPDVVHFEGAVAGSGLALYHTPPATANANGEATMGGMNYLGEPGNDIDFATVTLKAVGNETENCTLGLWVEMIFANAAGALTPVPVVNGTFTVSDSTPPSVTSPSADPIMIANDTTSTSVITVYVSDLSDISNVTVNLSSIGGDPEFVLENGAEGGIFNGTIVADTSVLCWHYLPVNATDIYGNSNTTEVIAIDVVEPVHVYIENAVMAPSESTKTIPIVIQGAGITKPETSVCSIGMNLTYNSSIAQVTEVTVGELPSLTSNIDNAAGLTTIVASSGSPATGDVTVAYVNITCIGAAGAKSPLNLSIETLANCSAEEIPKTVSNGSVQLGLYGDVNLDGNVWPNDAVLVMQYYVGIIGEEDLCVLLGDCNCDGNVWPNDAVLIMQYYVGIIDELPVC